MSTWMRATDLDGSRPHVYPTVSLRPVPGLGEGSIMAVVDQSAPFVTVMSQYGFWRFSQTNTDTVVAELRRLADLIDRNVAR